MYCSRYEQAKTGTHSSLLKLSFNVQQISYHHKLNPTFTYLLNNQQFLSCTTSRGRHFVLHTGHSPDIYKPRMMQPQQNTCPHLVALRSFISSQQIRHRTFSFLTSTFPSSRTVILATAGTERCFLGCYRQSLCSLYMVQRCLANLTTRVARIRQPSTLQLMSCSWSFLQVQTQLMPSIFSMMVNLLVQLSINSIKTTHSTLAIISSPLPSNFIIRVFSELNHYEQSLSILYSPTCFYRFFESHGTIACLESISSTVIRLLVFLLIKSPSCSKFYRLYIAIQVYSYPRRRLQQLMVTKVQYRSGQTAISLVSTGEDLMFLRTEEGSSQLRVMAKSVQNLVRSWVSSS